MAEEGGTGILGGHTAAVVRHPEEGHAADLAAIATMGFRGEALAAIASVSRIDLMTKTAGSISGVSIHLEAGEILDETEVGCPEGTTIVIRDLFFNVPARAKFLKKDATEGSFVENMVSQIAVSRPDVAIKFLKDGRESFSTPGDGKMLSAIYATGGKDLAGRMIHLEGVMGDVRISGYIGPAEVTRASRGQQHFFLNGRYVRSKLLTAALEEAYKGRLMGGRYPVCYLHLKMHPSAVDVNVHPAKLEVKFAWERDVFSAMFHILSSALAQEDEPEAIKARELPRPKEDNVTEQQQELSLEPQMPAAPVKKPAPPKKAPQPDKPAEPLYDVGPAGRPVIFRERRLADVRVAQRENQVRYDTVPIQSPRLVKPELTPPPAEPKAPPVVGAEKDACADKPVEQTPPQEQETMRQKILPQVRVLGEAFHTYIIAEDKDGLWLIDKHAAHEKLLFDQLKERLGEPCSQMLLAPKTVTLSLVEKNACLEHQDLLAKAGFLIEDFGRGSLLVRAIPMYLEPVDLSFVLSDMASRLLSCRGPENELQEELLKSVACKAAVKAGMVTDQMELQLFAVRVLSDDSLRNCPHGRPCVTFVSRYQLEKLFKRVL